MKIEKVEKLVANLHDKTKYVVFIRNLKQALNNGLVLKGVHNVIHFNFKCLAKTRYWYEYTLRKKAKNDFQWHSFWKNYAKFEKT